jgi:hypothetical protein
VVGVIFLLGALGMLAVVLTNASTKRPKKQSRRRRPDWDDDDQ